MWCYLSSFWTLPARLCPVVFLRQLLLKASLANQSWQVVFLVPGVDNRYLLWSPISCITKGGGEFSIRWQKDDRWHLLAWHSSGDHLQQLLFQFRCLSVRSNCRFRTWKYIVLSRMVSPPTRILQKITVLPGSFYFVIREIFIQALLISPRVSMSCTLLILVIFMEIWWWLRNRCVPCRRFLKITRCLERICLLLSRKGPLGIGMYLCTFIKLTIWEHKIFSVPDLFIFLFAFLCHVMYATSFYPIFWNKNIRTIRTMLGM